MSQLMMSEGTEAGKSGYPSLGLGNTFAFKFEDLKGRVHRFSFGECCIDFITLCTRNVNQHFVEEGCIVELN